jgi:hypothetical protein
MSGCCGYYCAAYNWGQFLYVRDSEVDAEVEQTTVRACGRKYADGSRYGVDSVVDFAAGVVATCRDLNFTDCQVHNRASAILARYGSLQLSVTRTTCLRCSSWSVIETGRTSTPSISFCNFYDCASTESWAVTGLHDSGQPDLAGLSVTSCIFKGNANNKDIGIWNSATKITIVNCVFAGPFPDVAYVIEGGPNYANQETESHKLFAMNTELCPAVYLASPTHSPRPSSRPFTPTSLILPSQLPRKTPLFDASETSSQSAGFEKSAPATESAPIENSALSASDRLFRSDLRPSQPVGQSGGFAHSAIPRDSAPIDNSSARFDSAFYLPSAAPRSALPLNSGAFAPSRALPESHAFSGSNAVLASRALSSSHAFLGSAALAGSQAFSGSPGFNATATLDPNDAGLQRTETLGVGVIAGIVAGAIVLFAVIVAIALGTRSKESVSHYSARELGDETGSGEWGTSSLNEEFQNAIEGENPLFAMTQDQAVFEDCFRFGSDQEE